MKKLYKLFLLLLLFSSVDGFSRIINYTVVAEDPRCAGDSGTAKIANLITNAPSGPYRYEWINIISPSIVITTGDSVRLPGGTYRVNAFDLGDPTSPVVTRQFRITDPFLIIPSVTQDTISCFGLSDGVAIINPNGASDPPYSYAWSNSSGTVLQTTTNSFGEDSLKSLGVGKYYVTISNSLGCSVVDSITLVQPTAIIPNLSVPPILCNGGSTTATVNPSGGAGAPYSYSWNGQPSTINNSQGGLDAANSPHSVVITDADGCTFTQPIVLTEPDPILLDVDTIDVTCFGNATGIAFATVVGGTGPFTFTWPASGSPVPQGDTVKGLLQGNYTVQVVDANMCPSALQNFRINENPELQITLDSTDVVCNADGNGIVTGTIAGGVGPYSWVANDPAATTGNSAAINITGLNGNRFYRVTVTDNLGCSKVESIFVNEPPQLVASFLNTTDDPNCAGTASGRIDITFSGGNGGETFLWTGPSINAGNQNQQNLSNLLAGRYDLIITDNKGCTVSIDTTLADPIPISGGLTFDPPSCRGGNDGRIVATPTDGSGIYTNYQFGDGTVTLQNGTDSILTGLSAGTYFVTITDSDGCDGFDNITVTDPTNPFELDIVADSVNCNGESTGGATATPRIPLTTGPYNWSWSNSAGGAAIGTDSIITGLPIGKYYITATDGNGCVILDSVEIEQPDPISTTIVGTNLNCNGDGSGTATATISNGNTPYSWSWNTTPPQTGTGATASAVNLDANVKYYLDVVDREGCTKRDSITLTEPTNFDLYLDSFKLVKCFGENNGAIFVSDSGGTAGAGFPTYVWTDGPTITQDRTDLIASSTAYKIVATDANGCKDSVIQLITEPNPLTLSITDTDSVSCFGLQDGTATAAATGGTIGNGYVYTWSTIPVQTGATATGLAPGNYTVFVTDSNGCTTNPPLSVDIFTPVSITSTMSSDSASCSGFNDGTATVVAAGGTPFPAPNQYTYLWDANAGNQTTATATNLLANAPNFYRVTVTDKNGCEKVDSVSVGQPNTLTLSVINQRNVDCAGNATGAATINVVGGTLPYAYVWENTGNLGVDIGTNNATLAGLPADTFRVTVTDGGGCNDNIQVIITEPDSLKGSITATLSPSCLGSTDGTATVTATGGSLLPASDYTYSWNTTPVQTTQTATGLEADVTYVVTITDDSACFTTVNVTLTAPNVFVTSDSNVQNVSCFGGNDGFIRLTPQGGTPFPAPAAPYTITWNPNTFPTSASGDSIFNLTSGQYIATIQDSRGCLARDTFNLDQPGSSLSLSFDTTDVSCVGADNGTAKVTVIGGTPGYTFNWEGTPAGDLTDSIFNLATGTYKVTVLDANGCEGVDSTTINPASPISVVVDPNNLPQDVTCAGQQDGSITIIASGGATTLVREWYLLPNRTTAFAGDVSTLSNLSGGTYRVIITDGPCLDSLDIVINEPDTLKAQLNKYDINCDGSVLGSAAIRNITGGNAGATTFIWTPDPGAANGQGTDSVFNLTAGSYAVQVSDPLGCDTLINFTINQTLSNFTFIDSVRNDSCAGAGKGYVGIESLTGGVPPYSFEWSTNPGVSVTDAFLDNLSAGNYTVTITDAAGCDSVFNFPALTEPTPFSVTVIAISDTCLQNKGNASIDPTSITGGTAPFTFTWPGNISGQAVNALTGDNSYTLTITDANGCVYNEPFTIGNVAPFTISFDTDSATCKNFANGAIRVTTNGQATGQTNYNWSANVPAGAGANISGLLAGQYRLTVTDAAGCLATDTAFVGEPDKLEFTAINTVPETCLPGNDGSAVAFITGGNSSFRYDWGDGNGFVSSNSISNLTSGNYSVTVQDNKFCSEVSTFNIGDSTPFVISSAVDTVSCPNFTDGAIKLTLTGAIAPITYNWSNPAAAGQGDNPTGLGVGTYQVVVTDGTTCNVSASITVPRKSNLQTVIRLKEDETCAPGGDGWAVVAGTNGIEPYSYSWSTNVTNVNLEGDSAFNLVADDYFVTTTDGLGCQFIASTRILSGANIGINVISQSGPRCFGDTARRTIEGTGGVAPYSFLWSDGTTGPTNNNLRAGTVSITITDSSNPPCEKTELLTIPPPLPISLEITRTLESCSPGNDASAEVTVTNGAAPLSFVYSGTGTPNGNRYEDLAAGTYRVDVTDGNGCSTFTNFTIENASSLPFSATIDGTDPTCANGSNGFINTQVTGGISSLSYAWTGGNGNASTSDPTGLNAGIYTVTITRNDFNCTLVLSDTLIDKAPISASFVTVKDDCPPANTGSATATAADGNTPYSYAWPTAAIPGSSVSGASGETFSNLPAGTFNLTVTDAIGCSNIIPFTIEKSAPFTFSANVDSLSCNGSTDANITLTVTGVSTPNTETYQWAGPGVNPTSQNQTNLGAGTYQVTVTDPTNGCEETETFILTEPDTISATAVLTNVSCNGGGNDGVINLTIDGGTAPYTIDWGGGINANPRTGLVVGDYTVSITDANNCAPFVRTYSITNQPQFTVRLDSTDISCPGARNGFITVTTSASNPTFTWNDGLATTPTRGRLFAGKYIVTVTDGITGCSVIDSTFINEEDSLKMFFTVTDENCVPGMDGVGIVDSVKGGTPTPGYTFAFSSGVTSGNNIVTQLSSGIVLVTVTDGAGCTAVDSFEVKKAAPFDASFIFTDAICQGDSSGTASIITSNSSGPLTFTWPFGSVLNINDSTQNKLLAGRYVVNVFDPANGCDEDLTIIIDDPDTIKARPTIINENCNPGGDGAITLNPTGGDGGPYTFNWSGSGVITADQNQTNLSAGTYFLTITDGIGCTKEDSIEVEFIISTDPNLTTVDVGCQLTGLCTGSAKASPTNGVAPYTFEWRSSTGVIPTSPTADSVGALCAGDYSLKITDASGCDTTILFTINGSRTILSNTIVTDETCGATANGSISVTPSGGDAPYTYAWSNSTVIDSNRTNLAPGNYRVTITDATGCTAVVDTAVGTENFNYTVNSTNLSCNGGNDGTASITITGGTAGFSFVWSPTPGNGQGTANISNLSVGTYSVTITKSDNGCTAIETVDIRPSTSINPNEVITNESCFGQNDGSIVLGVVGGAGNYTYNWSANVPAGTTGPSANGLSAGTYTVQIIDAAGCDTTITADIIAANDILASITENDATCTNSGICDGSAVLTVTSTGTFSYAWSPGITVVGNDSAAVNLCPGNYFVDITNATGCSKRVNFVIGGPAIINPNITVTNSTCNIPNGALSAAPTGGTGTLTIEWLDNTLASISTGNTIASLPAGAYFADIVDASGCRDTFPASINDIGAETISISASSNVSCFGGNDGSATVSFVCGDPSCTTQWFAAGGTLIGSGRTITGLSEGDYYVEVSNNSGCLAVENIRITEPAPFAISETVVSNSCSGAISGSITLSVSGGAGNFNYLWSPAPTNGQGSNAVSGLAAGSYTVVITDGTGCDSTLSFNITEPTIISSTFTTTSSNCNQADGQIVATVSGGTVATPLAYDYQWFDGNNVILIGETSDTLKNVAAGSYRLRVRDDNTCQQIFTVNLSDLNGPTVTVDSIKNAGCFGESNGGIFITASGNNPPFNYNWLPTGAVSEDLTGLPAGVYSVRVTDDLGCITNVEDTVRESTELIAIVSAADATCGECNGTASVSVTGGTAPYSYLWSNGDTANNADSLCGGNYSLVITDASGCSKSFDFGVNTIGGPTGETVSVTPASCANSNDGAASVVPIGGTPPYSYLWQHNGATTSSLTNLAAGIYFVQISDVRSCSRTVEIEILSPTAIELNPQVVSATCNQSDGSILLNVTGGQPPYSYNWFTATLVDTNFIDNRPAGLYPVSVTDANGCIESTTIAINNTGLPFVPNPIGTDVSCYGQCDGSLANNITTPGIVDFIWLDAQRNSIAPNNTDVLGTVCAGDYFLELTTIADGCKSYIPVSITEPDSITLSSNIIKNISCNGDCDGEIFINTRGGNILYTYSWSDPNSQNQIPANGLCAGTYTVTATDANGCIATTSVTLTDPPILTASITSNTNLICNSDCDATATSVASGGNPPYTFSWSGGQTGANPTNLCFGLNVLTVTDARNCSVTDTIRVSAIDTVITESFGSPLLCDGELINLSGTVTGSSITSFGWYLADSTTLLTTTLDTSFVRPIGSYTYFLIATRGTCSDTAKFDVTVAPNPLVNLESEIRRFGEDQTVIILGNEDPSYTYRWTPSTALDDSTKAEPTTLTEVDLTYTLLVTDTNGCTYTDSILIVYAPNIDIPSGFTPNGDGSNDVWNIRLLEKFPNASVQIYNRWGQLLYEQPNGYTVPWNGKYDGKDLPIGTYYYIIDLKDASQKPITGPITIVK